MILIEKINRKVSKEKTEIVIEKGLRKKLSILSFWKKKRKIMIAKRIAERDQK